MGFTKTFCYCANGKCKPFELADDGGERPSIVENEYWTDIKTNVTAYMSAPICVEHTEENDDVPLAVDEALLKYVRAFQHFRGGLFAEPKDYVAALAASSSVCTRLQVVAAELAVGSYSDGPFANEEPTFDQVGESDGARPQLLDLARLLARASLELHSAVNQGLDGDIAHHFFQVQDLLHEMKGLTLGAVGQMVGAESLGHHPGHPHGAELAGATA